jgi:Na+-transporting NADH:ubiquinone oxidoreductase subunit A
MNKAQLQFRCRQGLDLPLGQAPTRVLEGPPATRLAVVTHDYLGLRLRVLVEEGAKVQRGQVLATVRDDERLRVCSPASGTVVELNRGERRALLSIVLDVAEPGNAPEVEYQTFPAAAKLASGAAVRDFLLETGLWLSLRTRPYSRIPKPEQRPAAIFITATDTQPLGLDPAPHLAARAADLDKALRALVLLGDGAPVYLCVGAAGAQALAGLDVPGVQVATFFGPHPSGTVGYHIHCLKPVNDKRVVWHLGWQDALAVGQALQTGRVPQDRLVSVAGPGIFEPAILRARRGSSVAALLDGRLARGEQRILSGSVLEGRSAAGPLAYLGPFHQALGALPEDHRRVGLGWLLPGLRSWSALRLFAGGFLPVRSFDFTTSTHGGGRSMIPFASFDGLWPFDLPLPFLLRALLMENLEESVKLGCLELDEEDLALCTLVDPGKNDFGAALRRVLDKLQKEEAHE